MCPLPAQMYKFNSFTPRPLVKINILQISIATQTSMWLSSTRALSMTQIFKQAIALWRSRESNTFPVIKADSYRLTTFHQLSTYLTDFTAEIQVHIHIQGATQVPISPIVKLQLKGAPVNPLKLEACKMKPAHQRLKQIICSKIPTC